MKPFFPFEEGYQHLTSNYIAILNQITIFFPSVFLKSCLILLSATKGSRREERKGGEDGGRAGFDRWRDGNWSKGAFAAL